MPAYTVVSAEMDEDDIVYAYRVESLATMTSFFENPLHYTYTRNVDTAVRQFPALAEGARYCGIWFHTDPDSLIKHWQFGDGYAYDEEIKSQRTANTLAFRDVRNQSNIGKFVVRFPISDERGDIFIDEPLIHMYPGSSFQRSVSVDGTAKLSIPSNCAPDCFIPDEDVQIYLDGYWIPKSLDAAKAICQRVQFQKSLEPLEPKTGFHFHPIGRLYVKPDPTTVDGHSTIVPETNPLLRLLKSIGFRKG